MWKDREKILSLVRQKPRMTQLTRIYSRKLEMVEEALYRAIQDELSKGMHECLPLLCHCELIKTRITFFKVVSVNMSRAKELAYYFYIQLVPRQVLTPEMTVKPGFKFSTGWLTKFMATYSLKMRTGRGQLGDVDMEANRPAFEAIARQLFDYAPSDVYNCDETGLYLKVVSNRTLSQGRVNGRKPDNDVLQCGWIR
jgi:hypothetical protein